MTRLTLFATCLTCLLVECAANADDAPKKLTPNERKSLEAKWNQLNEAVMQAYEAGKVQSAAATCQEALAIARKLYPRIDFPRGHENLASSLNNQAFLYDMQNKLVEAEALYKEALFIRKQLIEGDHADLAMSLDNLAVLYKRQGKLADAEPLYKEALAMYRRLFKGDYLDLAISINNLALLYHSQGKRTDAEPLYKEALAMNKRLFKGDKAEVATSLRNLAALYLDQGKPADAELLFKQSLAMNKRLLKGDHPDLATSMNNLAAAYRAQEKLTEAEALCKDALAMYRRVFKGDHATVAHSMRNLAALYKSQGKLAEAEPLYRDALTMSGRIISGYAKQKAEGEALTLSASLGRYRDAFLSIVKLRATEANSGYDPAIAYSSVWSSKGTVARVYEQRLLQARAADPTLAKSLAELADARRRRAGLLLAPATNDSVAMQKRNDDIKAFDEKIARLNESLRKQFPVVERSDRLNAAGSADLQKAMPADSAVVDFIHYMFFEYDNDRPPGQKEKTTERYLAFVVTRDKVAWVDLDTAANIDEALKTWRAAITAGRQIPPTLPAKMRDLVWEKVRKEIPSVIKTVYICPDGALCRVPWSALPGDRPGTILLEDFAVATIPHVPFLLDKFWPRNSLKNVPTESLIVGGVKYDAELAAHEPSPNSVALRGAPLLIRGANLEWPFLPGTVAEAVAVSNLAIATKIPVVILKDAKASALEVLASLPKVKYAHFATHGFFADPSFRSIFQLDPKDYEQSARGERIGRAANNPLVMTGLVFAGANNPAMPGRGIVTGESLIDLDLSGLELAVLSACETGLGDVAGGEGTFGLQRAFHLAGTRNVVASLWKVPDQATAALMELFYRNLWEKNLSPIESLRQAQLWMLREGENHPGIKRGLQRDDAPQPNKDGRLPPYYWAAFTLSGPGR